MGHIPSLNILSIIHQRITAQLKLPEYSETESLGLGRDSYSVY